MSNQRPHIGDGCELPRPVATARHMPARTLEEIEARIEVIAAAAGTVPAPALLAAELVQLGEQTLEVWLHSHDLVPTTEQKEGFRLLALQRQAARGDPSFNACRETCRELAYHYNLVVAERGRTHGSDPRHALRMMPLVARHLCLFIAGKLQVAGLGEFCCASKPVRSGES